jgi:hypothetical protein
MEVARGCDFLGLDLEERSEEFRNNNDWNIKEIDLDNFYKFITTNNKEFLRTKKTASSLKNAIADVPVEDATNAEKALNNAIVTLENGVKNIDE